MLSNSVYSLSYLPLDQCDACRIMKKQKQIEWIDRFNDKCKWRQECFTKNPISLNSLVWPVTLICSHPSVYNLHSIVNIWQCVDWCLVPQKTFPIHWTRHMLCESGIVCNCLTAETEERCEKEKQTQNDDNESSGRWWSWSINDFEQFLCEKIWLCLSAKKRCPTNVSIPLSNASRLHTKPNRTIHTWLRCVA